MRIAGGLGAAALIVVSIGACNQLFAIEDPNHLGADAGDSGDAPTDAPALDEDSSPEVVGLGPPYTLSRGGRPYAGTFATKSATIAAGTLTAWTVTGSETGGEAERLEHGTSSVVDVGRDLKSPLIWGRWAGGTAAGITEGHPNLELPAGGGIHYVLGRHSPDPTKAPSKLDYQLIGSTTATSDDGIAVHGAVRGTASFVRLQDSLRVRLSLVVQSDVSYTVVSNPSASDRSTGGRGVYVDNAGLVRSFVVVVPEMGRACDDRPAECQADVTGFVAGSDFERLALVITISPARSVDSAHWVTVVAIFARQ